MANEEVLGPRKTMFVLVIVVGCFAVLWPRILSPLLMGGSRDSLQPNHYDREAGCCEVLFDSEVQLLEFINAVCNSAVHVDVKLSPQAAIECRKAVNETCGVDIAAFLKKSENVGKTTKMLLDTMKAGNGSCLKEHFGVPLLSFNAHPAFNSWTFQETLKQERPHMRVGPHPALMERGRAIPASAGTPPPPRPSPLPPHIRVRSSPLSGYFELDIKPPPIPGMRPPMGGAGGPIPAPKSSMGFVMPIYTICIIVFFVYTLSKILFKRAGTAPYEPVSPDPQFRRRVFRDDSRSSPDKLVVTAISGLVAEVQQQMEASYAQNQQTQEMQDNHARPYTNGTILHSGPVQIVASEYREPSKEKSPEPKKETSQEPEVPPKEPQKPEPNELSKEMATEETEDKSTAAPDKLEPVQDLIQEETKDSPETDEPELEKESPKESPERDPTDELIRLTEKVEEKTDTLAKLTGEFLTTEKNRVLVTPEKQSTPELLEEALKEDSPMKEEVVDEEEEIEEVEEEIEEEEMEEEEEMPPEKSTVKVLGMETMAHAADGRPRAHPPPPPPRPPHSTGRAHEAADVKSIYLETQIPQQASVLVADFDDHADKPAQAKHSPMVVSGKMTLSLIQDARRDTPDRDLESTVDDFTTASGLTQPQDEKEDNLSDEEIEEDVEIEEIEEEVEEEDEIDEESPKKTGK